MPNTTKQDRDRRPMSLKSNLHKIIKDHKAKDGRSIERILDEVVELGLRMKRLMPDQDSVSP